MPQPVTTVELQLAQVVGLLTEIRDLLQPRHVGNVNIAEPAVVRDAPGKAPARRASTRARTN